jgi:hypothetical protein
MEQNKEYQIALSTLNELLKRQQQLIDHGNGITKKHSENQREIESHFSSCFKALQARKDSLMCYLDYQFNDQRMILPFLLFLFLITFFCLITSLMLDFLYLVFI